MDTGSWRLGEKAPFHPTAGAAAAALRPVQTGRTDENWLRARFPGGPEYRSPARCAEGCGLREDIRRQENRRDDDAAWPRKGTCPSAARRRTRRMEVRPAGPDDAGDVDARHRSGPARHRLPLAQRELRYGDADRTRRHGHYRRCCRRRARRPHQAHSRAWRRRSDGACRSDGRESSTLDRSSARKLLLPAGWKQQLRPPRGCTST